MPDPTYELHDVADHIRDLEDYVYKRYVAGLPVAKRDGEREILLELLRAYSSAQTDADCYLPGVLAFEMAVGKNGDDDVHMEQYLGLARHWLRRWKSVAEDEKWEPIDRRLREIDDWFGGRALAGDAVDLLGDGTAGMDAVLGGLLRDQARGVTGQVAAAGGAGPVVFGGAVSGDGVLGSIHAAQVDMLVQRLDAVVQVMRRAIEGFGRQDVCMLQDVETQARQLLEELRRVEGGLVRAGARLDPEASRSLPRLRTIALELDRAAHEREMRLAIQAKRDLARERLEGVLALHMNASDGREAQQALECVRAHAGKLRDRLQHLKPGHEAQLDGFDSLSALSALHPLTHLLRLVREKGDLDEAEIKASMRAVKNELGEDLANAALGGRIKSRHVVRRLMPPSNAAPSPDAVPAVPAPAPSCPQDAPAQLLSDAGWWH